MAKKKENNSEIKDEEKNKILDYIFDEMSITNMSLTKATFKAIGFFKLDSLSHSTALRWIDKLQRSDDYARAREQRADNIFEEILNIADCEDEDIYTDDNGIERVNHDAINRDRLRIDARKWMLGKMQPKKYGDKIDVTSDGEKLQGGVTIFQLPDNGRD